MANKINRTPWGLLALLRGKVGGQTPESWENRLRPTIDMTNWYGSEKLSGEYATTSSNATGAGTVVSVDVPEGQIWVVQSVSARIYSDDKTVAQSILAHGWIRNLRDGSTRQHAIGSLGFDKGAAETGVDSIIYTPPMPLVVPAGVTFDILRGTSVTNAVAVNYGISVLYHELDL